MDKEKIEELENKYFNQDGYTFSHEYEHRFEEKSSAIMYSLIRHYKPKYCLEIGSSRGGSGSIIMSALQKNGGPFEFYSSELLDDLRSQAEENIYRKCHQSPVMLGDITKNLGRLPRLDFIFVDNDHDDETTRWIAKHIWPLLKKGGMYCMHDWAVEEKDGTFASKDGAWPETHYLLDLHTKGLFPFKKLFWTYKVIGNQETGFWLNV